VTWDLPFTREQFFATFAAYNEAIWPAHVVAYVLGIGALVLAARRPESRVTQAAVVLALAAMWAWTGLAYHIFFFGRINEAALIFGLMFVGQAAILVYFGIVRGTLHFGRPPPLDSRLGILLAAYALFFYPLIGMLAGERIATTPMFGVTPCPVTIFTFGLLLLTRGRVPWLVAIVPLVWAVIGGSAAVLLGVVQDWALPVGALLYVWLALRRMLAPRPEATETVGRS
jgi:hypothetical protein